MDGPLHGHYLTISKIDCQFEHSLPSIWIQYFSFKKQSEAGNFQKKNKHEKKIKWLIRNKNIYPWTIFYNIHHNPQVGPINLLVQNLVSWNECEMIDLLVIYTM